MEGTKRQGKVPNSGQESEGEKIRAKSRPERKASVLEKREYRRTAPLERRDQVNRGNMGSIWAPWEFKDFQKIAIKHWGREASVRRLQAKKTMGLNWKKIIDNCPARGVDARRQSPGYGR